MSSELRGISPRIATIIAPTLRTVLDRFEKFSGELGWVDMKFDPADGSPRDAGRNASAEFYRRDRVYGWIQGRALESMAAHLRWMADRDVGSLVEPRRLALAMEALHGRLSSTCFRNGKMTASFVMDPEGRPLGRAFPEDATTLSHLFCLRGLGACAPLVGLPGDGQSQLVTALRTAIDAANAGNCLDDQMKFGTLGGESYDVVRRGYEGQMIAIGACEILFSLTGAREDLARGVAAIEYTVRQHLVDLPGAGIAMIDAFGPDNKPLRDHGRIATNPGHAIEFAGLALGFFRKARAAASRDSPPQKWKEMESRLVDMVWRYLGLCRAPHGGIVRSMDAATGEVLEGFCPWWSSFEAARTFAEIHAAAGSDEVRTACASAVDSFLSTIEAAYLGRSTIGIPVQTISFEGEIVPIIPATPDIDAGYHTGMPLLVVDELMC